ncbi:MAG: VCBS repeat-containing protein [Deltaproteobacteria bacterium]|nr:VCBS repeat-containing protein [Deltaproteobacteria bacterium]
MRPVSINNRKMVCRLISFLLTLHLAVVCTAIAATGKDEFNYSGAPFTISNIKEHIIPIDMDGDGLKDLLCSKESTISIYFQKKDDDISKAFNFSRPDISIDLPGNAVGWDIDYNAAKKADDTDRSKRLMVIIDGKSVMVWPFKKGSVGEPSTLIDNLPGYLPKGAYPLNFIRDINSDGLNDIILPGNGKLYIYLQDENGGYNNNIFINTGMDMVSTLSAPSDIAGNVGQTISIPAMNIRDINNDGRNDLISTVDKLTEVFLGSKDGGFPSDPSFRYDLTSMTAPPKKFNLDTLDFSNILSALPMGTQQYMQDLDGDKIEDLLLLDNGKITVFNGTSNGIDLEKPRQILKSSGNVLAAFAAVTRDKAKNSSRKDAIATFLSDNQDETRPKDLILIRLPEISVGDFFQWFVFSKDLDVDFFIYKNLGKAFEKRPGRKITLTVKMPSALKLFTFFNDLDNREQNPSNIVVVSANLSKTRTENHDRLVLRDNTIQGFRLNESRDITQLSEDHFNEIIDLMNRLGFVINEDHYVMDMEKMLQNLPELGNFNLLELKDKQPDFKIELTPYLDNTNKDTKAAEQGISAVDLNGDSLDDIFLFTDRDDNNISGTLFLSR